MQALIQPYFPSRSIMEAILQKKPGRRYVNGNVNFVDMIDIDAFSIHELHYMREEVGYWEKGPWYYHFLIPGLCLDYGLRGLGSDMEVHLLAKYIDKNKLISVYIEHLFSKVETYLTPPKSSNVVIEDIEEENVQEIPSVKRPCKRKLMLDWKTNSNEVPVCDDQIKDGTLNDQNNVEESEMASVSDAAAKDQINENDDHYSVFLEEMANVQERDNVEHMANVDPSQFSEYFTNGFNPFGDDNVEHMANVNSDNGKSVEGLETELDEEEDSDYIHDEDNNVSDVEVDMSDFHFNVDEDVEFMGTNNQGQSSRASEGVVHEEVLQNDYFESGDESDGNELEIKRKRKLKEIQKQSQSSSVVNRTILYVSQTFGSKKEAREYIKRHAIESRRQLKIVKNDKCRLRAVCDGAIPNFEENASKGSEGNSHSDEQATPRKKGKQVGGRGKKGKKYAFNCPWVLHVSKLNDSETWMVKTLKEEHTCLQSRQIRACTSTFLGTQIVDQVLLY